MARRVLKSIAVASSLSLAVLLSACADVGNGGDTASPGSTAATTGGGDQTGGTLDCEAYKKFGDLEGTTVTVYTDEALFNAATPGANEIAVLTDA